MEAHRLAEQRSLALHEAIADRLRAEPELRRRAQERVAGWLADGSVHRRYARAWADLLELPLEEVCAAIVDPGETGRALRQCTPFAGIVEPRERWRIWKEARARAP